MVVHSVATPAERAPARDGVWELNSDAGRGDSDRALTRRPRVALVSAFEVREGRKRWRGNEARSAILDSLCGSAKGRRTRATSSAG